MNRGGFRAFSVETAAEIKKLWESMENARKWIREHPEIARKAGVTGRNLLTKADIARKYGVAPMTINRLLRGQSYKDCEYKAKLAAWIYATEE